MSLKRALATAAAGAVAVAGGITAVALPAGPAAADTTTTSVVLPFTSFGGMLVDPANQHLFVTGGAGSSSILVIDYSGNTVATIPDEPGASGLTLSGDGSTVYVGLAGGDAISAISTSTLTETARYDTGTGTKPASVAYSSGKVWFGYSNSFDNGPAGIGSVDPGTSPATVTLNATNDPPFNWTAPPELAATPAGDLVAGAAGAGPLELASYDVSTGTAATLTPPTSFGSYSGLTGMQITPDGQDVVVATSPAQTIFQVSDLSVVGTFTVAPNAAQVAFASDGTVAAGTSRIINGQRIAGVSLFAPGGSTPLNTYNLGAFPPLGLALSPDVSVLFAVAVGLSGPPPHNTHFVLHIITDPAQTPSTLTVTGPAAAVKHNVPVTLTGTLGGVAPYTGGQTLTVTRTDSAEPDGVALPDVTTAADGSFTLTDTLPKLHANQGVVTYQFSYAGDPLLTASSATFAVTVQPGNGNDNNS
jgi:hypothetical protein